MSAFGDRHPELDPDTEAFVRDFRAAPPLDWSLEQVEATRALIKASHLACFTSAAAVPIATTMTPIDGPNGKLVLSIKEPASVIRDAPVALFIHGGGWLSGDLETHGRVVDHLVAKSGASIVSVAYTLSPEVQFPVALEECFAALRWISEKYARPVSVIGDSAGGNLAAALCLMAHQGGPAIDKQILICPLLDPANFDRRSRRRYGDGDFVLSSADLRQMIDHYVSDENDLVNPLFSPMTATTMRGLPAALIITAECDALADEGKAYADRLSADGVPVEHRMYRGTIHDFPVFGDAIPLSFEALDQVSEFLGRAPTN